jgi:hypothetical protein
MDSNRIVWPQLRAVAGTLLGALLLMMILPSTGGVFHEPPDPKVFIGMLHYGHFWFYPDAFFYIGYFPLATGAIVFGALRRNKFEIVGWAMLGLMMIAMMADG